MMRKDNIIQVDDWTLTDLYEINFWKGLVSSMEFDRSSLGLKDINNNPIIEERVRKEQMLEFMWEILPQEHRISFFENEYAVFYIWASDISIVTLIKLHDLLINREISRVPDLISSTSIYKKMVEIRNKAFSDMKPNIDTKDVVLMEFYDKLTDEEVISLNTPEYVMVSGLNSDKVSELNEKLMERYTLLYSMDFGLEGIQIFVFQPIKK